ncbi:MAG: ester cyclase [Candidatus Aminicenantes bacterium]|nr:ester cyclase [Candidatus Aminicenantes bacterium]
MKKLTIIPFVILLCFAFGCQGKELNAELEEFKAQAELEGQNKELVKRIVEELNKGNIEIFGELYAPDYGFYSPSNSPKPMSLEELIEFLKMILKAFPDANWSIEELFAEGDRVIVRFIFAGTHEGEFQGIPATGNKVDLSSIIIFRIKNGKVIEEREDANMLGVMMQLGMELKPKEKKEGKLPKPIH